MPDDLRSAISAAVQPGEFHVAADQGVIPPENPRVRAVAFYLPQFHPIPQNDLWWGKGFTEWTNVTRALPRYPGHHQPILPADLGFYDLRNPEVLQQQAALARRYGIHGFCFHHYWFGGERLLEKPVELLMQHPEIDLPFCLCWANENWTRRWDGLDQEVLMAQRHDPEDDIAFIDSLLPMLRDPRYIRVGDRPVIMVYRPQLLPDILATARRWRVHLAERGIANPYLIAARAFGLNDPRIVGFDALVEFPPHHSGFAKAAAVQRAPFDPGFNGYLIDYQDMATRALAPIPAGMRIFRGVCPRWDNEARRPDAGTSFVGATPPRYQEWLARAGALTLLEQPAEERLVFINAWNEWAEGAVLEPDRHYGHAYLSATAEALRQLEGLPEAAARPADRATRKGLATSGRRSMRHHPRLALLSHDAHFHGAQMLSVNLARQISGDGLAEIQVLLGGPGELQREFSDLVPTRLVPGEFKDEAAWLRAAEELAAAGVHGVLSNTIVSAQALPALKQAGLQVACLVHELPTLIHEYHLDDVARRAASQADVVVFPSEVVRASFTDAFGPVAGRSMLLPQGLYRPVLTASEQKAARASVRAQLHIGENDFVVVGVGFGDRRKGLDMWPDLAVALRDRERAGRVVLVWVGDVELNLLPELRAQLKAAGLEDDVLLPGRTTTPERFIAAADAFLLSSREDPLPSAALEAAAHGLPVLCFEGSGGIPPLMIETGLAPVPMGDVAAMADSIQGLIADPVRRGTIGAAAARMIAERGNFATYAADLVTALAPAPEVSVIVPNYNYARYLPERLNSILAQGKAIAELILLDDASTDGSQALLEDFAKHAKVPVKLALNDANSGSVVRQWARGVELATAPFVWIAEADDLTKAGFLDALLPRFHDAGVVMAYCQSQQMDATGHVVAPDYLDYTRDVDASLWTGDYTRSGRSEIAEALAVKNTIPNVSAALFRRDALLPVLRAALPELTQYRNAADWVLYLRLLMTGRIAYHAEALNQHRRHTGSVTISSANEKHLNEISLAQTLSVELVTVSPEKLSAAMNFHASAKRSFGLYTDKTAAERSDEEWFEAICGVADGIYPPNADRRLFAGFPPAALQIGTTGQAGRATLVEAFRFYKDCRDTFARLGAPMRQQDRLLDFGVGWGRIGRFFLRDIDPHNLIGLDVDADFVKLCRDLFPVGLFKTCPPLPAPSAQNLPAGCLRFIVAYSVFSHLSEEACGAWMREFHRLLEPGGMVAVTTRGRWFFDYGEELSRDPGAVGYQAALGTMFQDFDAARARYDRGELVFATSQALGGGGVRDSSFYGETFIPAEYAARAWLPEMELAEFQFDPAHQTHPILFLRRR